MKFLIISLLILVILIPIAIATYSVTQTAPAAYAIMNDTKVVFGINATGNNVSFNCSLYLKTSSTGAFTENLTFPATNNTDTGDYANFTFVDGDRVWWKVGCYDRIGGTVVSTEQETVPALNANVPLDYDTNGVIAVTAWANYTQDSVNESITTPADTGQLALAGNGSVASVTMAIVSLNATDNVTLVASTDYSLASGIVYINSSTYEGNTSYWTYVFYNQTGLVLDTDYNISTDNLVYIESSTYVGDVAYWNYSYPGNNKLSEANSSVRILDVDDYYNEYLEIFMPIKLVGSTAAPTCDTTSAGAIYYDTDGFTHYGCNSTDWNAMYS